MQHAGRYWISGFIRHYKQHLERLKGAALPIVLSTKENHEFVVQDMESYLRMFAVFDRSEAAQGIRRGLEDVRAGRSKPASQFFHDVRKGLKAREHTA